MSDNNIKAITYLTMTIGSILIWYFIVRLFI